MPGRNKKVTHNQANLQLLAAGLFTMRDLFVTTRH